MMTRTQLVVLTSVVVVLVALMMATAATAGPVDVPAGQRQLFLDDYIIAQTDNLATTMHQPDKRGAVLRPTQPWELWIQTRSMPAWDEEQKIFKLWGWTAFAPGYTGPGAAASYYAQSTDGINWTKPNLNQCEVKDSQGNSLDNNLITVDPSLSWNGNRISSIVRDPDDPDPTRRYKGFLGCSGRRPIVSPDGIHWKRLDVPKIPSSDESNLSYDRQSNTFIATLKCSGPNGRSQKIWTSTDFENWTDLNVLFHADAEDQTLAVANIAARLADPNLQQPLYNNPAVYNADIYNMAVFRYEGLYVGLPAVYHATGKVQNYPNTDGFQLIQLAASRDLRTWKRLGDRQPFIGPSPVAKGVYDTTQLLPPSAAVVRGDELWFYYTGLKYRASFKYVGKYPKGKMVPLPGRDSDTGAVCLAVLRRDGFISLDAGEQPGTLLTKPFVLPGTKLMVNVDAVDGTLEVEILDADKNILVVSEPIIGDQLRAIVQWKSGSLAGLKGQEITLQFKLRNASFYSFWVEN